MTRFQRAVIAIVGAVDRFLPPSETELWRSSARLAGAELEKAKDRARVMERERDDATRRAEEAERRILDARAETGGVMMRLNTAQALLAIERALTSRPRPPPLSDRAQALLHQMRWKAKIPITDIPNNFVRGIEELLDAKRIRLLPAGHDRKDRSLVAYALVQMDSLWIDGETSGLVPGRDELIELAWKRCDAVTGETIACYSARIKPTKPVSEEAAKVNGYTPYRWKYAIALPEVMKHLEHDARGAKLAGQGPHFDLDFIRAAELKTGARALKFLGTYRLLDAGSQADPLTLSGEIESVALDVTAKHFHLPGEAHRAMGDVDRAIGVSYEMTRRIIGWAPVNVPTPVCDWCGFIHGGPESATCPLGL